MRNNKGERGHVPPSLGKIVEVLQEILKCYTGRVPRIVHAWEDDELLRSSIFDMDSCSKHSKNFNKVCSIIAKECDAI